MTIIGFLVLLVIAAVAGSLGMTISGYDRGGCLFSAIIGFLGAFIGMWLARQLGLPELIAITIQGETFPVVWSVIGSAILSIILGVLVGRRRSL
ncbi:hypothetical protein MASR2M66_15970 [Chloroflexota bacterium]